MKTTISAVFAAVFLFCSLALADETKPIELTAAQMDQITAGTLLLPNGNTVFDNFDNPAGDGLFQHPALTKRSNTARTATTGNGPSVSGAGNEGPWSAGVMSEAIVACGQGAFTGLPDC